MEISSELALAIEQVVQYCSAMLVDGQHKRPL